MNKKSVLIAAIGTSPAVLTETVWAMAHGPKPVVPNQIEVVTTRTGKTRIEKELLDGKPSVWESMVRALKADGIPVPADLRFGKACIAVIPDEMGDEAEDLRSPGDNMRAADVMLETIRKHTENPETTVYASIAGGRKSMSALMFSCMSLLGRTDDRVTHVLTTPDAIGMVSLKDGGTFYYPKKGHTYEYGSRDARQRIAAGKIAIEMFDVPFVRIRGCFQEKFKTLPPSYGTLVAAVQGMAPPTERPAPFVRFDVQSGTVSVDGIDCALSGTDKAILLLYMSSVFTREAQEIALNKLSALRPREKGRTDNSLPSWLNDFWSSPRSGYDGHIDADDLPKLSNQLREKLVKRLSREYVEMLCPKYYRVGSYPKDRQELVQADELQKHFDQHGA